MGLKFKNLLIFLLFLHLSVGQSGQSFYYFFRPNQATVYNAQTFGSKPEEQQATLSFINNDNAVSPPPAEVTQEQTHNPEPQRQLPQLPILNRIGRVDQSPYPKLSPNFQKFFDQPFQYFRQNFDRPHEVGQQQDQLYFPKVKQHFSSPTHAGFQQSQPSSQVLQQTQSQTDQRLRLQQQQRFQQQQQQFQLEQQRILQDQQHFQRENNMHLTGTGFQPQRYSQMDLQFPHIKPLQVGFTPGLRAGPERATQPEPQNFYNYLRITTPEQSNKNTGTETGASPHYGHKSVSFTQIQGASGDPVSYSVKQFYNTLHHNQDSNGYSVAIGNNKNSQPTTSIRVNHQGTYNDEQSNQRIQPVRPIDTNQQDLYNDDDSGEQIDSEDNAKTIGDVEFGRVNIREGSAENVTIVRITSTTTTTTERPQIISITNNEERQELTTIAPVQLVEVTVPSRREKVNEGGRKRNRARNKANNIPMRDKDETMNSSEEDISAPRELTTVISISTPNENIVTKVASRRPTTRRNKATTEKPTTENIDLDPATQEDSSPPTANKVRSFSPYLGFPQFSGKPTEETYYPNPFDLFSNQRNKFGSDSLSYQNNGNYASYETDFPEDQGEGKNKLGKQQQQILFYPAQQDNKQFSIEKVTTPRNEQTNTPFYRQFPITSNNYFGFEPHSNIFGTEAPVQDIPVSTTTEVTPLQDETPAYISNTSEKPRGQRPVETERTTTPKTELNTQRTSTPRVEQTSHRTSTPRVEQTSQRTSTPGRELTNQRATTPRGDLGQRTSKPRKENHRATTYISKELTSTTQFDDEAIQTTESEPIVPERTTRRKPLSSTEKGSSEEDGSYIPTTDRVRSQFPSFTERITPSRIEQTIRPQFIDQIPTTEEPISQFPGFNERITAARNDYSNQPQEDQVTTTDRPRSLFPSFNERITLPRNDHSNQQQVLEDDVPTTERPKVHFPSFNERVTASRKELTTEPAVNEDSTPTTEKPRGHFPSFNERVTASRKELTTEASVNEDPTPTTDRPRGHFPSFNERVTSSRKEQTTRPQFQEESTVTPTPVVSTVPTSRVVPIRRRPASVNTNKPVVRDVGYAPPTSERSASRRPILVSDRITSPRTTAAYPQEEFPTTNNIEPESVVSTGRPTRRRPTTARPEKLKVSEQTVQPPQYLPIITSGYQAPEKVFSTTENNLLPIVVGHSESNEVKSISPAAENIQDLPEYEDATIEDVGPANRNSKELNNYRGDTKEKSDQEEGNESNSSSERNSKERANNIQDIPEYVNNATEEVVNESPNNEEGAPKTKAANKIQEIPDSENKVTQEVTNAKGNSAERKKGRNPAKYSSEEQESSEERSLENATDDSVDSNENSQELTSDEQVSKAQRKALEDSLVKLRIRATTTTTAKPTTRSSESGTSRNSTVGRKFIRRPIKVDNTINTNNSKTTAPVYNNDEMEETGSKSDVIRKIQTFRTRTVIGGSPDEGGERKIRTTTKRPRRVTRPTVRLISNERELTNNNTINTNTVGTLRPQADRLAGYSRSRKPIEVSVNNEINAALDVDALAVNANIVEPAYKNNLYPQSIHEQVPLHDNASVTYGEFNPTEAPEKTTESPKNDPKTTVTIDTQTFRRPTQSNIDNFDQDKSTTTGYPGIEKDNTTENSITDDRKSGRVRRVRKKLANTLVIHEIIPIALPTITTSTPNGLVDEPAVFVEPQQIEETDDSISTPKSSESIPLEPISASSTEANSGRVRRIRKKVKKDPKTNEILSITIMGDASSTSDPQIHQDEPTVSSLRRDSDITTPRHLIFSPSTTTSTSTTTTTTSTTTESPEEINSVTEPDQRREESVTKVTVRMQSSQTQFVSKSKRRVRLIVKRKSTPPPNLNDSESIDPEYVS